jgi:hypothetical protein
MKSLIKKLWASFENTPGGFSARKLSAFTAVIGVSVIITHKYATSENLVEVLVVWLDAIELSVRDSINVQLVPLKNEIVDLKTQLKKESQANEDLYKKIDALRVAMPEF